MAVQGTVQAAAQLSPSSIDTAAVSSNARVHGSAAWIQVTVRARMECYARVEAPGRSYKRGKKRFCKQVCARPRGATMVPESLAGAVTDASSGRVALVEAVFRPFWAKLGVQY